jgi:hypothetical protein
MWRYGHTPEGTEQNLYECTVLRPRTIRIHRYIRSGHLHRIFWVLREQAVEQLTSQSGRGIFGLSRDAYLGWDKTLGTELEVCETDGTITRCTWAQCPGACAQGERGLEGRGATLAKATTANPADRLVFGKGHAAAPACAVRGLRGEGQTAKFHQ